MKLEINPRGFWSAVACHRFESGDMSPHSKWAFTLIELLVVVTLIVVLLALLTPALDRAIYQAELTACGANLHGLGAGVQGYAMAFKRSYPYRPGVHHPSGDLLQSWRDNSIATLPPFAPAPDGYDDRPILRGFVSLNKQLVCPLTRALDIEGSVANTYSTYQLWFGLRFVEGASTISAGTQYPGMVKLGDRLTWGAERLDVLASDEMDIIDGQQIFGAHPDRDGKMFLLWYENNDINGARSADATGTGGVGGLLGGERFTYTRWHYNGALLPGDIGAVDRNFLRQDGSVQRITDISLRHMTDQSYGQRLGLVRVPIFSGGNGWPVYHTTLPGN